MSIPLVVLVVAFVVATEEQTGTILGVPMSVAGPVFAVLLGGAIFFSYRNWRCPACDKYLGKVWNPRHCHSFGIALR